jgi:hypothetical protein
MLVTRLYPTGKELELGNLQQVITPTGKTVYLTKYMQNKIETSENGIYHLLLMARTMVMVWGGILLPFYTSVNNPYNVLTNRNAWLIRYGSARRAKEEATESEENFRLMSHFWHKELGKHNEIDETVGFEGNKVRLRSLAFDEIIGNSPLSTYLVVERLAVPTTEHRIDEDLGYEGAASNVIGALKHLGLVKKEDSKFYFSDRNKLLQFMVEGAKAKKKKIERLEKYRRFCELRYTLRPFEIARELDSPSERIVNWFRGEHPKIKEKVMRLLINQGFATERQYEAYNRLGIMIS